MCRGKGAGEARWAPAGPGQAGSLSPWSWPEPQPRDQCSSHQAGSEGKYSFPRGRRTSAKGNGPGPEWPSSSLDKNSQPLLSQTPGSGRRVQVCAGKAQVSSPKHRLWGDWNPEPQASAPERWRPRVLITSHNFAFTDDAAVNKPGCGCLASWRLS